MYLDNEDLIGKWFKRTGNRNGVFLATKFAGFTKPDGKMVIRNDPDYVKEACAKSLKRLETDVVDLYYCHRLNGEVPIEDVVQAMTELVKCVWLKSCLKP